MKKPHHEDNKYNIHIHIGSFILRLRNIDRTHLLLKITDKNYMNSLLDNLLLEKWEGITICQKKYAIINKSINI